MARTFKATLEPYGSPLNWVIARVPFDAAKLWGKRGRIRVLGEINGFPFRASLFPAGDGTHCLLVTKQMQRASGARVGNRARITLEPDLEERVVTVPAELERALSEDPSLRRWFDGLTYSIRNYLVNQITSAKGVATRERRADRIAEQLFSAMEAEQDPPPMLQSALAGDSRARAGWRRMSLGRRREHLLGIYYYQSPEARARRVGRAMAEARGLAEKGKWNRATDEP